jgi:hypothetical protein
MPDASINKSRGLGMLVISAASNAAFDPTAQANAISKTLADEVDRALEEIEQAEATGKHLEAVADFMVGKRSSLPAGIDVSLAAHAKHVRHAHQAGLLDAEAVAADVRRYVNEALAEVSRLKTTFCASTRSAVRVLSAKAYVAANKRAGLPRAVSKAELRLKRLQGIHRFRYDSGAPRIRRNTSAGAAR